MANKIFRISSNVTGTIRIFEKDENGNVLFSREEQFLNVYHARRCQERPDYVNPERWAAMQKWLSLNPEMAPQL